MNTNLEIYSFLNIINSKLGKTYKITGKSPLPKDFEISEKAIGEVLFLQKTQNEQIFPSFIFGNKSKIKKYFKNSKKNIKKILKNEKLFEKFDKNFKINAKMYFSLRLALTKIILKDFRKTDFDETDAFREIHNLNPIFDEIFSKIYENDFDFESVFENLEQNYQISYAEKLMIVQKKKKEKLNHEQFIEKIKNAKNIKKTNEKSTKIAKKSTKIEKNANIEKKETKKIQIKQNEKNRGK